MDRGSTVSAFEVSVCAGVQEELDSWGVTVVSSETKCGPDICTFFYQMRDSRGFADSCGLDKLVALIFGQFEAFERGGHGCY